MREAAFRSAAGDLGGDDCPGEHRRQYTPAGVSQHDRKITTNTSSHNALLAPARSRIATQLRQVSSAPATLARASSNHEDERVLGGGGLPAAGRGK